MAFIERGNDFGSMFRTHSEHSPSVTTEREGSESHNGFARAGSHRAMRFPAPKVDIRASPAAFDELVDWLEAWSYGLVLLEEYPRPDVLAAVTSVDRAVRAHRASFDPWLIALHAEDEETSRAIRVLVSDHQWFETSIEQFWWFFRVVDKEDHGGHRQALGQYGRVFAEALRRHRADERRLGAGRSPPDAPPAP